ncbi:MULTISPECIES: DUF3952 domain-containing protein [Bacillus cereus group]|uniref:DUF3952 domain-containing protein n=4 Tax=Bacillus cereus group TaxID=86661 RepID=A0A643MR28_BACTU|nr:MULTISPECIES: DUF3952 domain-containing protein [Bacillus cereus group]AGE77917.1 hypothetical protein HD73_2339 [Bacillus thuringiensis serovar kurstaki str. HD73]AHZ50992.1 hypothetical protein YBT1520_11410 [Bacillus thuringiensis serovar kurstaki str. YBT-1520]AKJ57241.1 hypothetical protein XI92_02510 [Bacillus thuringiensis]ALL59905.1 hypothetical protein AQ980_19325 [Bacillus thuringiensis]AMX76997.1 hypothetical protein BtBc_11490 [Bacillus thuringiensis]
MKLKKKAKMMIVLSIIANLLSGCGFGETNIEYERLVKALDEGDMKTVMSASDDGYAYVKEEVRDSTFWAENDNRISVVYQTTGGVYNIKEKKFYGTTLQEIASSLNSEQKKEEIVYRTSIKYEDNQSKSPDQNLDVSNVRFIFNRLKGIDSLRPKKDKKRFSESSKVTYYLTESEFQEIINDKLKVDYDKFDEAILLMEFSSAKDSKENPMEFTTISITMGYEKKNKEGRLIRHDQKIAIYLNSKEDNDKASKTRYEKYEKQYSNSK